ncbi:Transcriptional regulator MntR [Posidoniimonas polymericola]|uniref:Transcriptional regulator MntR n=1 Tax=Posidoniimonas polymericola TaxID=2528002 RepID=A0A5C5YU78_9BACT|nr:manganese-binding transcriptional regulator MntR [Posidoniimonas polymericola]TWT78177.1 Transcriptional regulator MntR [Posidoniimonas polymericola]
MPNRPASRHRRTRNDHASETAEDYVEAIADVIDQKSQCRAADLVRHFGVSAVTVSKTVGRLRDAGLVEAEPYGPLGLTPAGRRLAAKSRRRHETVLEFLRAIGVSDATAQVDAEGIEHHVSDETLRRMRAVIKKLG